MKRSPVDLAYDRGQLLQAKDEYNKAKLLPTTLDEYKQVLDRIVLGKITEHPPRESKNTWMGWRAG